MTTFNAEEMRRVGASFGLQAYQIDAFLELFARTSLTGKRVLEVGGSDQPRGLVLDYFGAAEWVSVDSISGPVGSYQIQHQSAHYAREGITPLADAGGMVGTKPYLIFDGGIEDATELPGGHFDVVLSITSFEHILAFPAALAQMKRLLKPDGCVFSYHGPLWSCYCGHHIWVDDELNFNNPDSIPDFGHLLYSPPEMFHMLSERFGSARAQQAVLEMYHLPRVNRLFYEDYQSYFDSSGFSQIEVIPYYPTPVPSDIQARLELRHPGYHVFDAYGMVVFLR
jgi:SAM-dependent methyltransferase